MQYDADEQPDPDVWLELDETERLNLVIDYHRRTGVQLENLEPHAVTHVVVENQVALGEAHRKEDKRRNAGRDDWSGRRGTGPRPSGR